MNDLSSFIPNPNDPFGDIGIPFRPPFERIPIEWDRPVLRDLRWGPARIRILIVSDGNSYSMDEGFALGIMVADTFDAGHPDHPDYARFEVTKAHRGNAAGVTTNFSGFRFNPGSLDNFDEVWLFGFTPGNPYLSAQEVGVLDAFMDRGGGVLAMGDHEDLGLGLCGGVKRVRSMRKWWFNSPPPPAGMERAPDNADLTRNDTVHAPSPGGNVNTGSESDATPQNIYPNYRYRFGTPFWRPHRPVKYPHPLLCGPRGAIKVLPDHPHEGDCIIPNAAFASEYPGDVDVEIIARGRNVVGRTKQGYTITEAREFGLIGTWDGHASGTDAGRVAVDSTWHHWFNVNLFGLRNENGNEYKDVLAYFRNCAIWLAPKAKQAAMRRAGQLVFLLTANVVEHTFSSWRELRPERFYPIGIYAKDALGRIAPQCQSAGWFFEIVGPMLPKAMLEEFDTRRLEKLDALDGFQFRMAAMAADAAATTIYGGAVNAIAVEVAKAGFDGLEKIVDAVDDIAARGAKMAVRQVEGELKQACRHIEKVLA